MRRIPLLVMIAALPAATGWAVPAHADPAQQCRTTPSGSISTPWSQRRLQPERAWPLSIGSGVTVAVIDSGVDAGHPQLAGAVTAGPEVDDRGPSTSDCSGHGTMVAGIIAARPMVGSPFHGVAPGARVLSIRQNEADPATGTVYGDTTGMATAIRDATAAGARVINISATTPADTPALRSAVGDALAHDVVVVAAAGNDDPAAADTTGTAPPAVYYPAAYPGVLAVAATGTDDRRIDFSHSGSYVGIGAPGKDIVSTGPNGPGRYAMLSGTSFATPFVAGTAALVRAYRPGLTGVQVVARLKATADPPPTGAQNAEVGAGIVNPYAAVATVIPGEQHATPAPGRTRAQALPANPPRPPATTRTLALAGAGLAVLLVATAFGIAAVLPRGRLRRWRPTL